MLASSAVKEPIGIGTKPNVGEIKSLQYGRGIAALLVCLFHYEGAMNQIQTGSGSLESSGFEFIFRAGHSGVEFFFILSGFIIFHAHRIDLRSEEHTSELQSL